MSELLRVCYTPLFLWNIAKAMTVSAKREIDPSRYPSQVGKTWIVTGSTGGIGLQVAIELAELGANVWLVGRSDEKTSKAAAKVREAVASATVDYLVMDYADLATIKPGLDKFLKSGSPLHGVVHNAGVMNTPASAKTAQGYEMQLGVNCIASWLVQTLLNPVLIGSTETIEGRIVWVSSIKHLQAPYKGDDIAKDPNFSRFHQERYGLSKAVNLMESIQWTVVNPTANVKSVAVHPGLIKSDLWREASPAQMAIMNRILWPIEYGAASEMVAAVGDVPNNSYIVPWGKVGQGRFDIVSAAKENKNLSNWLDLRIRSFI